MVWFILSVILALCCYACIRTMTLDSAFVGRMYPVLTNRAFRVILAFVCILTACKGVAIPGMLPGSFAVVGSVVYITLVIGCSALRLLVLMAMARGVNHLVDWMFCANAAALRRNATCDLGRVAEKRGDDAEAERLYLAALTGDVKRDGDVHLALGNFYQRLGSREKAIRHWRQALEGDLASDQHLVTAQRLSDMLREAGRPVAMVKSVLMTAIGRHPHAREAQILRSRLEALAEPKRANGANPQA